MLDQDVLIFGATETWTAEIERSARLNLNIKRVGPPCADCPGQ